MRSGAGRLHAEQRARDDLDALGRLVARGLELEDALHLAETRLLVARLAELVAERDGATAHREVHDERADASRRRRASSERGRCARASSVIGRPSFRAFASRSAETRRAARSFALRARGFAAASSSVATSGFFVSGSHVSCVVERALHEAILERVEAEDGGDAADLDDAAGAPRAASRAPRARR